MNNTKHISVMLNDVVDAIDLSKENQIIDVTLGGGGHTFEIIRRVEELNGSLKLLGIDQDKNAVDNFAAVLKEDGYKKEGVVYKKEKIEIILHNDNFDNLTSVRTQYGIKNVNAVIADLGFSTDQLEDNQRGFSFKTDGELDMRMSPDKYSVKASDLLNVLSSAQLVEILKEFGDFTWEAKRIASSVVSYRKKNQIKTVSDLLKITKDAGVKGSRHVEARVFQVIRIVVNHEIDALVSFLPQSLDALGPLGVVSILTFHSGEDRTVKHYFKKLEARGIGSTELIKPSQEEIRKNSKSSSAKLRIFRKYE